MNYATDGNGECLVWPSPCPVCRPEPTLRDTWLAVVRLGKRRP
jgi:hypothetical protein